MPLVLARFISVVFQPLLLSSYGVMLLLHSDTWMSYTVFPTLRNALYIIVVMSTFLLPALTVLMLLQRGAITSLEMRNRTERNWPYMIALLFYSGGYILIQKLPLPAIFGNMIIGAGLAIFIAFLVNLKWKISIHMMGLGGLAGMFFALGTLFGLDLLHAVIGIVAVAGITGSARLALAVHTPAQVYVGFIAGFVVEWAFIYIYNLVPAFAG